MKVAASIQKPAVGDGRVLAVTGDLEDLRHIEIQADRAALAIRAMMGAPKTKGDSSPARHGAPVPRQPELDVHGVSVGDAGATARFPCGLGADESDALELSPASGKR